MLKMLTPQIQHNQKWRPLGSARGVWQLNNETTHPDHHRLLSLELGYVSVSSGHLGAVQGPETAHHFDGALRRVGHLPPRFTDTKAEARRE